MYKKVLIENYPVNLAKIEVNQNSLLLSGDWTWSSIDENILSVIDSIKSSKLEIDGRLISHSDTTGMYFVHKLCQNLVANKNQIDNVSFNPEETEFYQLTKDFMLTNQSEYYKYQKEEQTEGSGFFQTVSDITVQFCLGNSFFTQ